MDTEKQSKHSTREGEKPKLTSGVLAAEVKEEELIKR